MTERAARRVKPSFYLTSDGRVLSGRPPSRLSIILPVLAVLLGLGAIGAAAGATVALAHFARAPREWADFLRQHRFGGDGVAGKVAARAGAYLDAVDVLGPADDLTVPPSAGAAVERSGDIPDGRLRKVISVDQLRAAVAGAEPGDLIILAPGHYRLSARPIAVVSAGTEDHPITVRAVRLGEAVIESDAVEAFDVSSPHWRFENLVMRGVCADHSGCEHAIHVTGDAVGTVIRNNRLEDFNAHLKINGDRDAWPDNGVIEGNTLIDTAPRRTRNPVTPIDLVGASAWHVRNNFIADFVRGGPGEATYGGFFKGAGDGNLFERNTVLCAWKLRDPYPARVGLSLGGGGTGLEVRRDKGKIGMEQVGGVIRDNLIAFCSGAGIYLNRAARSLVIHNTLLDTAGIQGRFIETSAEVIANIVDGVIRADDEARLDAWQNDAPALLPLFLGWHAQRGYFRDPARLDLVWAKPPGQLPPDADDVGTDLCGEKRGPMTHAGAFDDFNACLRGSARP